MSNRSETVYEQIRRDTDRSYRERKELVYEKLRVDTDDASSANPVYANLKLWDFQNRTNRSFTWKQPSNQKQNDIYNQETHVK